MFTSLSWCGKIWKFLLKILLEILISAPIAAILCFIIPKYTDPGPYVKYIIESIGYWSFGFILVSMSNRVLVKASVIIHYR